MFIVFRVRPERIDSDSTFVLALRQVSSGLRRKVGDIGIRRLQTFEIWCSFSCATLLVLFRNYLPVDMNSFQRERIIQINVPI